MKANLKILLLVILFFPVSLKAQSNSAFSKFKQLSRPEKCWVIKHPFIAKKTFKITQIALNVTDSIADVKTLDGDLNGGQVDAFRHSYWMAILTQQIGWRKAIKLGRAHEKANYIDFKRHRLEDGTFPDKASGEMDLFNNNIGAKIGKEDKNISEKELQIIVINAIIKGEMKIIKKDTFGNFLDEKNNILPTDSLKGKWDNGKCLVESNYIKK